MSQKKEQNPITNEAIRLAISHSGYLIEQRVAERFNMSGYYVLLNPRFPDPLTEKTREIDIQADSTYRSPKSEYGFPTGVHWSIVCECENNSEPIVFFPYETVAPEERRNLIKCFGVPMKIWRKDEYIDFRSFLPFREFHHYCRDEIATQYCTFIRPKHNVPDDWIATHVEEQHDTFAKLISAIEYDIHDFYKSWELPEHDNEEPMYFEFRYPLIVLGGKLMEARLGRRLLRLRKARHIRYLTTAYLGGKEKHYLIDVITEDYLTEYISLIHTQMNKVRRLMSRRKEVIAESIIRILHDVRATQPPADNYEQLLCLE